MCCLLIFGITSSGGVDATRESIESWFKAGACAIGMGSKLVAKDLVESGDYAAIQERVRQCLAWIKETKAVL